MVVDNASDDGSVSFLRDYPNIKRIRNSENLGFSRGCNIGAEVVHNDYVLFLNSDARLYSSTLKSCVDFMNEESNSSLGILGVPLEDGVGHVTRSCSRFPSLINVFFDAVAISGVFPSLGKVMHDWDHKHTRVVDQVIGAFFFVRRVVFDELGGFDERFFLYFDEVDLAFRAKKHGWGSIYYTGAKAFHYGGGSTVNMIPERLFYSLRSRLQYFTKHFGRTSAFVVLSVTIFLEFPTRLINSLFRVRSRSLFIATIKAYWALVIWLRSLVWR